MKESRIINSVETLFGLSEDCPVCNKKTLEYMAVNLDVPHFGQVQEFVVKCSNCGWRSVDFVVGEDREPVKYTYRVKSEKDLNTRIIRSSTGSITIPELGIEISPSRASEGYITNIEGVLQRVLAIAENFASGDREKEVVEKIRKAINGEVEFTFILEDPHGNSAIEDDSSKNRDVTDSL